MLVPTLAQQIMGWERKPALKSKWKSSVSALDTLESGINIRVCLLIFEVFSRGYVLIKGGYVY